VKCAIALAATVALVACGSPAAPPPLPASGTSVDALLTTLDAAADRACACTDRYCTDDVERELKDALQRHEPARPLLDDASLPKLDAAVQRGIRCMWARGTVGYAYEAIALEATAAYRDRACACADRECLVALDGAPRTALTHLEAVPRSVELKEALQPLFQAANACKLEHYDAGADDPVGSLAAIADGACACKDSTCIRDAVDAFLALSNTTLSPKLSDEQHTQLSADILRFSKCVRTRGTGGL
jgi:hypothetical protein